MNTDPSLLAVLQAAVAADPENIALRQHFAELLFGANRFADALENCVMVLGRDPANVAALAIAARAGEAIGDPRATGYRALHTALSGGSVTLPSVKKPSGPPPGMPPEEWIPDSEPIALPVFGGEPSSRTNENSIPRITLSDVAGMETVKRRLQLAFLGPLKNPELRAMYNKSLRGGLMLYGPPGCGKTFVARAVAGELSAHFIAVGLADVLDMYVGQSERNLHELFQEARRNRPCVLFFDEIDALGRKRSLRRDSATRDIVNQFLHELDGIGADNEGVFVLSATNHPWDVDSALRRPGRFDRTLLVLPPDTPARLAILRSGSEGRPLDRDVDFARLAKDTEDYSGADIVHLCDSAAENAMADSIETGKARPIKHTDYVRALKDVKPSVRPWFDTAKNYAQFSNEGGVYDDLLEYLRSRRML